MSRSAWETRGMTVRERLEYYTPERPEGACWPWHGSVSTSGYGVIALPRGKQAKAHRVAYTEWVGPFDSSLTIDHVAARGCIMRSCVNPEHLEPVPGGVNSLRGDGPWARNAKKDRCKRGHLFDEDRIVRGRKYRSCSLCRRALGLKKSQASGHVQSKKGLPRGVTARGGGYIARVSHQGSREVLGPFKTAQEASAAYWARKVELAPWYGVDLAQEMDEDDE